MRQTQETSQKDDPKDVKAHVNDFVLNTLGPVLVIIRVTIIFVIALLADTAIIAVIRWSFGGAIQQYPFAVALLEGIQLLSALGTAVAYIIYLIRSLIKDAREVLEEIR